VKKAVELGFVVLIVFGVLCGAAFAQQANDAAADTAGETVIGNAETLAGTTADADAEKAAGGAPWYLWALAPLGAVFGLIFAFIFYKGIMKESEGEEKMKKIAQSVRTGAMAYLNRQYKVVGGVMAILFVVFLIMAYRLGVLPKAVPFAFLTGGFFSALSGYFGMRTATNAGARTANAARKGLDSGLQVAFRSGAVMGLVVVGLALLNISIWFIALYLAGGGDDIPELRDMVITLLASGIGASTQALFARVGGGIFTKAADVGADLVGKVEAGIPEDDPRNPATIADNVGDNVGDVAGMGADLFESYAGSILAAMQLGLAAVIAISAGAAANMNDALRFIFLPMTIAGIGIFLSVIGIFAVKTREGASQRQLLKALNTGIKLSSVLLVILALGACWLLLGNIEGFNFWGIWLAIVVGLASGIIIGHSTEIYTSADYKPTQGVAEQANTGPATVIIDGLAVGMKSTWIPVVTIVVGILLSFGLAGGFTQQSVGLYGIAIAAVGMLSTLGIVLSTDAYGPIADNAGGNAEMSGLGPEVRERTDALDSLGNTTAATGKGFAIGSAALTTLALIAAFIEAVRMGLISSGTTMITLGEGELMREVDVARATINDLTAYFDITLMNPLVLAGMLIGSMLAFLFCALTMKAVGRAAGKMVDEVRRQFKEIAGILEGTAEPDYAACVDISTRAAQAEMILPSLLAIVVPVIVGLVFGVAGVVGLLASGLATGFVLAVMMANAGGSWDNAKKYIETGKHGGKGSPAHKAAVVGDTVGDPFKDTSGPSLNILIKLMSMVSVVFAGLTVRFAPIIAEFLGMGR